jgi:hypothetical protein
MCGGGGGDQTVTQKTELDPAMRRLLYGGTEANPRGGFGSTAAAVNSGGGQGGGNQYNNSDSDSTAAAIQRHHELFPSTAPGAPLDATGIGNPNYGAQSAPTYSDLGSPNNPNVMAAPTTPGSSFSGNQGLYAMGGPVMPQQGLASLNQGQMPMMNGQMPNLSDPMTAATLAMAVRSPQMRYGSIMSQPNPMMSNPMQGYAMGGYIEGPGTGTSDSIPAAIYQNGGRVGEAALSDGEFVMTKAAVDGAGGAAQMYRMMHDLEKKGTA